MASLGRLIFFDQPGSGASDPVTPGALPTLEQWADSITAVLDDLGSREAVLVAANAAFAPAALFAATHPSRTTALVVLDGYADPTTHGRPTPDEIFDRPGCHVGHGRVLTFRSIPTCRGTRRSGPRGLDMIGWPRAHDSSSLNASRDRSRRAGGASDNPCANSRPPARRRSDDPARDGKDVADHIAGAKYVELPGRNLYHFVEPWRDSFQEIAEFLTGQQADVADDRVLATVLFTDIVDSTRRASEMGDRDWHALLDAHDAVVRSQLARFRGREVNTSGDGFLAMFDGPQRAIRCAMAIRDAVQALGIEVRAGLHTGECEVRGDDIGGIAVHIGARVSALAGPNDVLVSSTLRDLVIGSGLEFEDRGAHELKGVPGEWHLFAVAT